MHRLQMSTLYMHMHMHRCTDVYIICIKWQHNKWYQSSNQLILLFTIEVERNNDYFKYLVLEI